MLEFKVQVRVGVRVRVEVGYLFSYCKMQDTLYREKKSEYDPLEIQQNMLQ